MVLQVIQEFLPAQFWNYFLLASFLVGAFRLGLLLFQLFSPFFTRRLNLTKRYNGGWALVTGGSEGIGCAIAEELAREGFDIILVSRSIPKLQSAREKLLNANKNIKVQIKSIDFQKLTTEEQYLKAFDGILQKDISVLVNNVGYCITHKFAALTFQELRRQMKINCSPIAVLSRLLIEKMVKRTARSGIINLSSISAIVSFTGCGNYSATKRFDDYLSQALAYQYKDKIDFLTVRPSYVTTEMTKHTDSFLHTSTSKCSKSIINALGVRPVCYGPFSHNLQGLGTESIYGGLASRIYSKSMGDISALYDKIEAGK